MADSSEKFLQKTGNYRALHAYRKAEVLYDYTFRFCEKFLAKGDRTRDQMIQAARSGKQNIAEGSKASVTSTETEIKLIYHNGAESYCSGRGFRGVLRV